ncbi:UNVERIFIED_CONTAM: BPTI/Kunitz domain-containing protein [Trichonephila clavipes]
MRIHSFFMVIFFSFRANLRTKETGGCNGNSNNFRTLEDCKATCGKKPPSDSICKQKKEAGPCKAAIPRYYYNKKTKKCEKFIYGGCNGNSNNFRTLEDCEAACGRESL